MLHYASVWLERLRLLSSRRREQTNRVRFVWIPGVLLLYVLNGLRLVQCLVFASIQTTRLSSREQWLNLCEKTNHKTSIRTRSMEFGYETGTSRHQMRFRLSIRGCNGDKVKSIERVGWPTNWVLIDKTQLGWGDFEAAPTLGPDLGPNCADWRESGESLCRPARTQLDVLQSPLPPKELYIGV